MHHEKTGLLSPEKGIVALAKSIETFYLMNNETYQVFAKNARQHVENEYDSVKNSERLRAIYEEIKTVALEKKSSILSL